MFASCVCLLSVCLLISVSMNSYFSLSLFLSVTFCCFSLTLVSTFAVNKRIMVLISTLTCLLTYLDLSK